MKLELPLAGVAEMKNTLFCSREILHLVLVIKHNTEWLNRAAGLQDYLDIKSVFL